MDEVQVEAKLGAYPNLDDFVVNDEPTLLLPCVVCNKTFRPEVLQRHSKVCEKNVYKKRKTFDSFKQRVKGTDLAEFLPFTALQKRASACEKPPSPKETSHWKEKHEAFVSAIRAARGDMPSERRGSGEPRSILRPPDHERCPYCDRHFGPKAFDRHQEWCREQHSRHPPSTASIQAKERLEARIKYRAPPIKSKRALTREKYSPLVQRKALHTSSTSNPNSSTNTCASAGSSSSRQSFTSALSPKEPSQKPNKCGNAQTKDSAASNLIRGGLGRTSLRASQRQSQPPLSSIRRYSGSVKDTSVEGSSSPLQSNNSVAETHYVKDNHSLKSSVGRRSLKLQNSRKIRPVEKPKPVSQLHACDSTPKPLIEPQRKTSDIDTRENLKNRNNPKSEQVWSGNQKGEPYDPYASAERQMLELLHSDSAADVSNTLSINTCTHNSNSEKQPSPAASLSPSLSPTASPKPTPLETSPTSAFTRYSKESELAPPNIVQAEAQNSNQILSNNEAQSEGLIEITLSSDPPQSVSGSEVHLLSKDSPEGCPQPPPRSFKRSASLQACKDVPSSTKEKSAHIMLKSSYSLDSGAVSETDNNSNDCSIDNRPGTYDVDSSVHVRSNSEKNGWVDNNNMECSIAGVDVPLLRENANGGKSEILQLDTDGNHNETRESREIREITELEGNLCGIDSLLEEVVRMQRSVSMLSEMDSVDNKRGSASPFPQSSSARSRRNRTGKMHIKDFLFPAEVLEQENENLSSSDIIEGSSTVFGSTKSRMKNRRLFEHMLFPTSDIDINANKGVGHEDEDDVVSSNASANTYSFPVRHPTSPVALTSKVIDDDDDGLPRPKPVTLSTHSSGAVEANSKEPELSMPTSPTQPPTRSRQSTGSRLSADSAYSSLNRKSPIIQVRSQVSGVPTQELQRRLTHGNESPQSLLSQSFTQSLALSSSSGSESSLPPLTNLLTTKRGARNKPDRDTPSSDIVSATTPLFPKLSKFCHECGTKFSVSLAKFCCECGARRLELS